MKLKTAVRLSSVVIAMLYPFCISSLTIEFDPITPLKFFKRLQFGVIVNFGLWFITTESARKMKTVALLLYLPSLVFSPFFSFGLHVYLPIPMLIYTLFVLTRDFSWRKCDSIPT